MLAQPTVARPEQNSNGDQAATKRFGYRVFVVTRLEMDDGSATPVSRALWFIESHFGRELTLEEIADACWVSRYHMSRGVS
jgi:hypothetical protein